MPKAATKAASRPSAKGSISTGAKSVPLTSKPPSPGETPAPATLPKSLLNALPAGVDIIRHVQAIEALYGDLQKQIAAAEKAGAVQLARAFVVLHRLNERMLSEEKAFKSFKVLWKETKELTVPNAFEQAGVPNIPLDEGFRVGITVNIRASVIPGQKEAAFTWLEEHDKRDLIQETLNASTLSAFAKERREKNLDLPEDIFNVALMPNTSVTKT